MISIPTSRWSPTASSTLPPSPRPSALWFPNPGHLGHMGLRPLQVLSFCLQALGWHCCSFLQKGGGMSSGCNFLCIRTLSSYSFLINQPQSSHMTIHVTGLQFLNIFFLVSNNGSKWGLEQSRSSVSETEPRSRHPLSVPALTRLASSKLVTDLHILDTVILRSGRRDMNGDQRQRGESSASAVVPLARTILLPTF